MESPSLALHEKISLIGESLWVQQEFRKQRAKLEMCECGTEKIISKSTDPFRMRASLLSLIFANQLIYTHFREQHDALINEFNLPALKAHPLPASHASPNWFLHKKNFNHESMTLFRNNFQACMRSLTAWLKVKMGRHIPELHSIINDECRKEFGKLSYQYFADRSGGIAVHTKIDEFHPEYLKTHFRIPPSNNDLFETSAEVLSLPVSFGIISAHATTGETWSEQKNSSADKRLYEDLTLMGHVPIRIHAYSPETGHMEPSWCVELSWDPACDLGLKYKQDAIYFVVEDMLYLTFCDEKRLLVPIGSFSERLD